METTEITEPVAVPARASENRGPWGAWATLGFGLLVVGVFVALQTAAVVPFAVIYAIRAGASADPVSIAAAIQSNGLFVSVATWASGVPAAGLVLLLITLRRGPSLVDYLGLRKARWKTLGTWFLAFLLFAGFSEGVRLVLDRPLVPEWMQQVYASATFQPLLWSAIVVAAPMFEELFFRGFLLEGLRRSRLGPLGAAPITSLAWALIHLQYDAFDVGWIFLFGLFLAAARLRTGSLWVPILLHAFNNLVALLETAWEL